MSEELPNAKQSRVGSTSPSPSCDVGSQDVDPGVLILFFDDEVHCMLGLQGIAGAALPAPNSVPLPPAGVTVAQSSAALKTFIDNVGLKVGMKTTNLVHDARGQRLYGLFDGLSAHTADRFEAEIGTYHWAALPPATSVGKFVRVSPSGEGRTTMTNIPLGAFPLRTLKL